MNMNAYEVLITLSEKPPIWRKLLVPQNFTFANFHYCIQDSMGWNDSHLYEFTVYNPVSGNEEQIGIPDEDFDDDTIDSELRSLNCIFNEVNNSANYLYDFGDNWNHKVELIGETESKQLPRCIAGEGLCPPDDIGGLDEYLRILQDPDDEDIALSDSLKNRQTDFIPEKVYFRDKCYEAHLLLPKDEKIWLHYVLQGQYNEADIVQELYFSLPPDDVKKLYKCVLTSQLRYRNRALALLAARKGISEKAITDFLFISKSTIRNVQKVYDEKGIESIIKDKHNVPKKHEKPEYIEKVFSILHAPPSSYGYNRTTWKQSDLKEVMSNEGFPISKGGLSQIISDAGYKYKKAKTVLTSNDPEYKEKLEEIKNILSNLGEKEKFFSIDEYGPFAIKIQGGKSLVAPGTVKTVPQWQKSKGNLIMTAALELSTNQITHFYSKKKNTDEMIKLLNILIEQYSDEETIYFSWDAASWHASKKLYEAVDEINSDEYRKEKKVPYVKLAPLPTCAQFLNVIESVFSGMARAIIHNSNYQSVKECKVAIDTYFTERNEHFRKHPKKAGNKIWGKERVQPEFSESNNCKDPMYR